VRSFYRDEDQRDALMGRGSDRIVLGIDPGTAILGFGVVRETPDGPRLVECGAVTTPSGQAQAERLPRLYDRVRDLITKFAPTEVAIERLFFTKNVATALSVGEARGVVVLAAALAGLPVSEYTPTQIKQAVGGYGKATKDQMREMVRLVLALDAAPHPDDVADAVAVALCHLNWSRFQAAVGAATCDQVSGG
jgi:crossover junction endodeoxyribonuclease RuvC